MVTTLCLALCLSAPTPTPPQLPVFGQPVPELQAFDDTMQLYMSAKNIPAGVLGVMRQGRVVYLRGFGVPENTPMRLASVEKPITAAAVRMLANQGALALTDPAFDLNGNGGILNIAPWMGTLGDSDLVDVTVQDLIDHRGGWDSEETGFDPQFETDTIGTLMGLGQPANRQQVVSFMLAQQLQHTPGTEWAYSNFGFMVLGLIVEARSGQNLQDYVRSTVLTPTIWVPATEIFRGQTFLGSVSPREPFYLSNKGICTNIFDPNGPGVWCPYGSWSHHIAFQGHGNLVASAAPVLEYLDRFVVWGGQGVNTNLGAPLSGNPSGGAHTGRIDGTSTIASQGSGPDPVHIVVLFDKTAGQDPDYAADVAGQIRQTILAGGFTWPTDSVDGFYVDSGTSAAGFGGYSDPFGSMSAAIQNTQDGSKLHLKPGVHAWSGTLAHKALLDAPFGGAVVGTGP